MSTPAPFPKSVLAPSAGLSYRFPRDGLFQSPPSVMRLNVNPAARSETPDSDSRMAVSISAKPMSFAIAAQVPYSFEHAFFVPSVARRLISRSVPLGSIRALGRPQIATPHKPVPLHSPIDHLCPTTGAWWRWYRRTKAFASSSVVGTIRKSLIPRHGVVMYIIPFCCCWRTPFLLVSVGND